MRAFLAPQIQENAPDRKTTPGTAEGTERASTVAVASAISVGVTLALDGCLVPGWGNDGLIRDPICK